MSDHATFPATAPQFLTWNTLMPTKKAPKRLMIWDTGPSGAILFRETRKYATMKRVEPTQLEAE